MIINRNFGAADRRKMLGHIQKAIELDAAATANGWHLIWGNAQYEQTMRAAGKEMFDDFVLAMRHAPEYRDREIEDQSIVRALTAKRAPRWWHGLLDAAGFEGGPWYARLLIDWHVDTDRARKRHRRDLAREGRMPG